MLFRSLVESHSLDNMQKALDSKARIIGVNNRNLETFKVDIKNSIELRRYVPKDRIYVAESGISSIEDVRALRDSEVDALLIGSALIRNGGGDMVRNLRTGL